MTYPIGSRLTGNTYRIDPTGVAATDTAALAALNTAIGTGKARIVVADNGQPLVLDAGVQGNIQFMGEIELVGETRHSQIKFRSAFNLNWGGYAVIPNMSDTMPAHITRGTMAANTAGAPTLTSISGVTLAADDTVFVWGENDTPGVEPHTALGHTHPGELHRINRVSGSTAVLSTPMIDACSTTPRIAKVAMLKNCGLRNLYIWSDLDRTGTATQTQAIDIFRTRDFILEDVVFAEAGPGYVRTNCNVNCRVHGLHVYGQPSDTDDYGITFGASLGGEVAGCKMENIRHPFTTGCFDFSGHRYGTAAYVLVRDNHYSLGGDGTNTWVGYDCHSEGFGVRFENNVAEISNPGLLTIAFFTRGRDTRFINNEVRGANDWWTYGFKAIGSRCQILNNRVEGATYGVLLDVGNFGNSFNDHTIQGNTFRRIYSSGIMVNDDYTGNGLRILDNKFFETAGNVNGIGGETIHKACISLWGTGTGHIVRGNHIEKTASYNDYSIDTDVKATSSVKIQGNYCTGYGSGRMGVKGETGDSPTTAEGIAMTNAYDSENYIDP